VPSININAHAHSGAFAAHRDLARRRPCFNLQDAILWSLTRSGHGVNALPHSKVVVRWCRRSPNARSHLINGRDPQVEVPQGLKPRLYLLLAARLDEGAQKVVERARSIPQALKRGRIFNDLTARVNSCPSPFAEISSLSATSVRQPFPTPIMRRLLGDRMRA
jgi:hypothetical protein